MAIHYPRRTSKIKKVRKMGFRARMKTKSGRKIINRRRRIGRKLTSI
jgi:large subunit ribosomal protein L34